MQKDQNILIEEENEKTRHKEHTFNFNWRDSTIALHGGEEVKYGDAHNTPIFATSTFSFPNAEIGAKRFAGEDKGFIYTRLGNPTVVASEKKIAYLEGRELLRQGKVIEGHAFSTGMGAIGSTLLGLVKSGDEIVATNPVYGGTTYLIEGILKDLGVKTNFIKTSGFEGIENVKNALTGRTKVLYLESPANPNLSVTDILETAKIAKELGITVVVDNTFATPIAQRPLELGADVVVHSTTKYLNGHGTTTSGIIAVNNTSHNFDKISFVKKNLGATQSPFDAFLVMNGMKTLPLRMKKHCENAQIIAEYLADHPKVQDVYYPGLPTHPDYKLATKQMNGMFGGMIAIELKGGNQAGKTLMNNVEVFTLAVSLGTVDSLIQHPRSMTHAKVSKENCLKGGITDGLVRISVGLEDIDDLIEDLSQALKKIG